MFYISEPKTKNSFIAHLECERQAFLYYTYTYFQQYSIEQQFSITTICAQPTIYPTYHLLDNLK